jgi:hypothetical protein
VRDELAKGGEGSAFVRTEVREAAKEIPRKIMSH